MCSCTTTVSLFSIQKQTVVPGIQMSERASCHPADPSASSPSEDQYVTINDIIPATKTPEDRHDEKNIYSNM